MDTSHFLMWIGGLLTGAGLALFLLGLDSADARRDCERYHSSAYCAEQLQE